MIRTKSTYLLTGLTLTAILAACAPPRGLLLPQPHLQPRLRLQKHLKPPCLQQQAR